jgi:hypothetical protein
MLATLNSTSSRAGWTLRGLIAAGALAVLALPVVYLSATSGVLAEDKDPSKPESAATAEKEPAIEFLPPPSPPEEKILAALEEPTTVEFTETPLTGVSDSFAKRHKIQIELDYRALEDVGISGDVPITRHLTDVKLESALRLLLRDLDLTYLVKDEVLLITTQDVAAQELFTRTYPVGDLVDGDYNTLIDTITTAVKPASWDEVRGPGSASEVPKSNCLVISQTREAHDEVLELLRALRAARKVSAK